jgi:hypothetical protein
VLYPSRQDPSKSDKIDKKFKNKNKATVIEDIFPRDILRANITLAANANISNGNALKCQKLV